MIENITSASTLTSSIKSAKYDFGMESQPIGKLDAPQGGQFKDVLSNMVKNVNDEICAPDKLLKEAMLGNKDVDVHQVMTAISKADISINVATQVVSKVIQAYDKILQIQV